jgi:hypothetical protein
MPGWVRMEPAMVVLGVGRKNRFVSYKLMKFKEITSMLKIKKVFGMGLEIFRGDVGKDFF